MSKLTKNEVISYEKSMKRDMDEWKPEEVTNGQVQQKVEKNYEKKYAAIRRIKEVLNRCSGALGVRYSRKLLAGLEAYEYQLRSSERTDYAKLDAAAAMRVNSHGEVSKSEKKVLKVATKTIKQAEKQAKQRVNMVANRIEDGQKLGDALDPMIDIARKMVLDVTCGTSAEESVSKRTGRNLRTGLYV